MTFDSRERSAWDGEPVGLLRLSRGALVERYTTGDRAIIVGGETYTPMPGLGRTAISDSPERQKGVVTLDLAIDAPCAAWWRPHMPSQVIGVVWMAVHRGDTGFAVEWTGKVVGPRFTDTRLFLDCEQNVNSGRGRGLVLRWQRGCPLPLYSKGLGLCNVDKEDHAVPGAATSLVGTALTVAAFDAVPDGRLAGGFVEWTRPDGEPEIRSILAHAGAVVVLQYGSDDLPPATDVIGYPGCAHNAEDCDGYFGNMVNYGGELLLPVKSPFDGNPL